MNNNMSFYEFIDSPDTVDFVIRQSDYLTKYINDNPKIMTTQVLTGGYVIAYTDIKEFEIINNEYGASIYSWLSNVLGILDYESLKSAGITEVQQQLPYSITGRGVLMGFVDTGIDYTQDVFKYEDGTSRIQYIYDQTVNNNPPEGFYIGTEYNNAQINEALTAENPYDIVPQQDISGHGTFLASVAAGRKTDRFTGAAPDTELIAVKLKKARPYYLDLYSVPENQENAFESSAVMLGVEYILLKARELGRPVVICLGLGSNFGSHDGFSLFEEYLNGVSILKGVCLCNAAGNEYQARHHMEGIIPGTGESVNIDIKVDTDAGDVIISIWNKVSEIFAISVRSPEGEMVEKFAIIPGKINETNLILSKSAVRVVYYFPSEGSGNQITMVKLINATPGVWTLIIHGVIVLDGIFHAWLPLTNFVSPDVEFLTTSPYSTITIPGTMVGAICSGAYDSINNILYAQSSWGPTLMPRVSPDLVAPGVNVGGYYPMGYGTMTGTSAAAAITAGACALMLQWGIVDGNDIAFSTNQIRAYLIRGCDRNVVVPYPNPQLGYGTLNLVQSFQIMRGK